jgi:hypothetical protein
MWGEDWPNNGEIDIMEAIDGMNYNLISLHTRDGCKMANDSVDFTGTWNSTNDCYTSKKYTF